MNKKEILEKAESFKEDLWDFLEDQVVDVCFVKDKMNELLDEIDEIEEVG